jgi:hypothetical protein
MFVAPPHREYCARLHEWRIEEKARLEEKIRQRQAEAERKRREEEAAAAKARIDRLMKEASALRMAADIRSYVEAVCRTSAAIEDVGADLLESWRTWALDQANAIDPVASRAFLSGLNLPTPSTPLVEET